MKVLLVQPPTHGNLGLQAFMLPEPLGLETVAANLMDRHEVRLLDMRLEPGLRRELGSFKPDAVGVAAAFTADVYSAYRVLEIIKEHDPGIMTFVGGQHATMAHTDFSGRCDAVVLGEGEMTVPDLLRCWEEGKPLQDVAGLAFRHGDRWIQTAPRPLIQNLNETPFPARSLAAKYLPHYRIGSRHCVSVEISRGCPYRCKFCAVWRFFHNSHRSRSPEKIIQELERVESRDVFFTDDNALVEPSLVEKLIGQIKKIGLRKRYRAQLRADSIVTHRDLLARWKSIGLETAFVGFESITQRGLDAVGKRLEVNYVEEAITTLHELGISVMGSFIVSPDFFKEDFAALRRFVKRMKLPMPVFSVLTPLPGTVLYEERAKEITCHNFELYDLMHSVLPTRLPLKEFYQEYVRLYLTYFSSVAPARLVKLWNPRRFGGFLKDMRTMVTMLKENHSRALARHHQFPPGKLLEGRFPKQASIL